MVGRTITCTACRASLREVFRLQPKRSHATKASQPASSPMKRLTGINSVYEPKKFDNLEPTDLAAYWDTIPPNKEHLDYADKIFKSSRHSPVKLFSAAQFRTIPFDSNEPEVAFIGRSNVGKSSIINALTESEMCYTSKHPGKTTEMNAFGIGGTKGGESKIVLLDMPGYGKASRREWGVEIMKYLQKRKQYVLYTVQATNFCYSPTDISSPTDFDEHIFSSTLCTASKTPTKKFSPYSANTPSHTRSSFPKSTEFSSKDSEKGSKSSPRENARSTPAKSTSSGRLWKR